MKIISLLLIAPLGLGACAPPGVTGAVEVGTPVYAGSPVLATVSPGVEVVAGWDTPLFFADGFFWNWDDGFWYRSSVLGGERIRVRRVPLAVAHIERPEAYAHFRPEHYAIRPIPTARMHGGHGSAHRG